MLLVASETGHVYTFATRKLQPMITSESGKALIQTCLNSPDPTPTTVQQTAPQNQIETVTVNPEVAQTIQPAQSEANEQRMSETGYEETSFQCQNNDEDVKVSIFIKWTPPPQHQLWQKIKIKHTWKRWGTPQNFFLPRIDELGKQLYSKNCWSGPIKKCRNFKVYKCCIKKIQKNTWRCYFTPVYQKTWWWYDLQFQI